MHLLICLTPVAGFLGCFRRKRRGIVITLSSAVASSSCQNFDISKITVITEDIYLKLGAF